VTERFSDANSATRGTDSRYRRGWPRDLVSRLLERCRVHGRLLDLGCGTGKLLFQLAPFFQQAVGIDPEPDMLREAKRLAGEEGMENVEWMLGSASELRTLEPALGRFDVVTIGTAFHFMDPRATLGDLQRIAAGGVAAVAYNGSPMWLYPERWARALRAVLETRLGPLSDADFPTEALDGAEAAMRALGYRKVERWERLEVEMIGVDFIIGHILSAVSVEQIPPSERQDFAREVTSALTAVEPSGRLVEKVKVRAVIADTNGS